MKAYLIRIVAAALSAAFSDVLVPMQWKKYTGMITGLFLLLVLIQPITDFQKTDFFSDYALEDREVSAGNEIYADLLRREFSEKIANDVRDRVRMEFSRDVSVEAELLLDDQGNLEKILSITIRGNKLSEKIRERISYVYDVEEVILVGE